MAIFHLNHASGNDSNDGSSWALAWKSLTSGALAARIAPGDTVRIAKTPDPTSVGNATWTNLSKTITLATSPVATIDMCATAWTPVSNVTSTTTAVRKEGSLACAITVGAAFTDGLIAYKTISSTNYSAYQQISLWMRSSVVTTALKICLCSDTVGAIPVDELTLPPLGTIDKWYPITVNKGSALGSAIQSVALYAIVDPGVPVITIDNVIACKAVAAADSLNLKSLISKNNMAYGGVYGWYGIQSINGTTVMLDNDPMTLADAGRGYSGTTETITTYKRETVTIAAGEVLNENGTELTPEYFHGGFNTANDAQDGETVLDGLIGALTGLSLSARSFVNVNRLSFVRFSVGLSVVNSYFNNISIGSLCNNTSHGFSGQGSCGNNITIRDSCNNTGSGVYMSSANLNNIEIENCNNNNVSGIVPSSSYHNSIKCTNSKNNAVYGVNFNTSQQHKVTVNTANNGTSGINIDTGTHYFNKSTIAETNEVTGFTAYGGGVLYSTLHDDTQLYHKVFMEGGIITSQSAVRYAEAGAAWRLSPTSTLRNSYWPVILSVAKIAVDAGNTVTVKAWFLRDSIDIIGKLVCRKDQLAGMTADSIHTITAGINTWEELSVAFTPVESGVVEIEAWAFGGTTYSVYVDSIRAY